MNNKQKIITYLKEHGPASISSIAKDLNIAWNTANTTVAYLLKDEKIIEKKRYGRSRVLEVV